MTHKELLELDGKRITCKIDGIFVKDSKIRVEYGIVYVCQNLINGLNCENRLGYDYSWLISHSYKKYEENNEIAIGIKLLDSILIEAGVDKEYTHEKYTIMWMFGDDYKKPNNHSTVTISDKYNRDNTLVSIRISKDMPISEANRILDLYNIKIVEKSRFKIKGENGKEIEIDLDKAKELGLIV